IDLHLSGLEKLGAEVKVEGGDVVAHGARLRGAAVGVGGQTVTGAGNIMMGGALGEGGRALGCAACEAGVVGPAQTLNKNGARIQGAGTKTIRIEGVRRLGGAEHTIIPDRIETGTFIAAAAITGGTLDPLNCCPGHVASVIEKFRETGLPIEEPNQFSLRVR